MFLVVGADGMIGRHLARQLSNSGLAVAETTRRPAEAGSNRWMVDLASPPETWQLPPRIESAVLCAALTSMDLCEREPEQTRRVNVEHTLALAKCLRQRGAHLVFLSTNQVFDGSRALRREEEQPCPRTEYGRQKAEVEERLLEMGNSAVVRLTKVLGGVPGLFRQWRTTLQLGGTIEPFADMVFAPVPLALVVDVLTQVVIRKLVGVVHVSADRDVSYAEVAMRLAQRLLPAGEIRPVSYVSKNLSPALAPTHTTLDTTRIQRELGLLRPGVWTALDPILEEICHV